MKVLVIGSNGQLGRSLQVALPSTYPDSLFFDRSTLDLQNTQAIQPCLSVAQPDVVINASAYTAVDQAEQERELAEVINHHAVARIADFCCGANIPLIHVSTDYVFDGSQRRPYQPTDLPNPASAYGASKLAGEQAIQASGCEHIIVRTAWVFSAYGQNFLKTMIRLGGERDELSIVSDQIGCPTHAGDLAHALIAALEPIKQQTSSSGVYHYAGDRPVSWFEFADAIFARAAAYGLKVPARLSAIPSNEYPTPAPRPAWSVLDSSKFAAAFGAAASNWQQGIDQCLAALKQPLQ